MLRMIRMLAGPTLLVSLAATGSAQTTGPHQGFEFQAWNSPRFAVTYQRGVSPDVALWIESEASRALARVSDALGHELTSGPVSLLFVDTAAYPSVGAPAVDRASRRLVIVPTRTAMIDVEPLAAYALAHVVVDDLLAHELGSAYSSGQPLRHLPLWMSEGVAEHLAGVWHPGRVDLLRDAVRDGMVPRLSTLSPDPGRDTAAGGLHHALGHAAFDFARWHWGQTAYTRLLVETARRGPSAAPEAIRLAFRIEPDGFDDMFLSYLERWVENQR